MKYEDVIRGLEFNKKVEFRAKRFRVYCVDIVGRVHDQEDKHLFKDDNLQEFTTGRTSIHRYGVRHSLLAPKEWSIHLEVDSRDDSLMTAF